MGKREIVEEKVKKIPAVRHAPCSNRMGATLQFEVSVSNLRNANDERTISAASLSGDQPTAEIVCAA